MGEPPKDKKPGAGASPHGRGSGGRAQGRGSQGGGRSHAGPGPQSAGPQSAGAQRDASQAAAGRSERPRTPPVPQPSSAPAVQPHKIYALDREQLERESTLSFVRGSGPGGQHRNKVETGVRLVHEPSGVVIVSTDNRSQVRNREAAFERLIEKLEGLNHRPKKRKKTRKPRSANRKRLNAKRQNSEKKQGRRSRGDD